MKLLKNPRLGNTLPILGLTAVLLGIAGWFAPGFLAATNLWNLMRQAAPLGIICIGQTLTILTAGVDLSVGSVAILSNVIAANIMQGSDANNLEAFATCLAVAVLIGTINGLAVAKVGINPFVMTLAMSILIQGAALVYAGGAAGGEASPLVKFLGVGRVGGSWRIPVAVLVWLALAAITLFLLERTTLGRRIYATGSNKKTARLSGVSVSGVLVSVYVISSVSARLRRSNSHSGK